MPNFENFPPRRDRDESLGDILGDALRERERERNTNDYGGEFSASEIKKESERIDTAAESREKFNDVRFQPIYREGEIVAYKSSEFGRKAIKIDPSSLEALTGLDVTQKYSVRVLRDTNPNDSQKGAYIVEIINEQEDGLEHRNAQVARAARLKGSAGFKVLASIINEDPDLSAEYRTVVGRHEEYKNLHTKKDQRHRNFTGMLAGIMMSERANDMLDKVIDRTITAESTEMKQYLQEAEGGAPVYVPGIVVGAGVYGEVDAATRQMYVPDVPNLTIDQNPRVGGQFAKYRADLFRLNSRRRPELPDKPHLPGTAQSLNSSGKHSVMQSSDTGSEAYAYQSTISDTARVNFFLSGKALVNTEVRKVRRNRGDASKGALIVESLDKDSDTIIEVATDRLTFSTGLGEEADRLDPFDKVTQNILREEKKKISEGENAQVYSFTEFAERLSDPTNPFPLRGINELVLSGDGDSGNVIAGLVLGYESQLGKTATQLDSIKEIFWLGQKAESKEQFLASARARYAQIGLEFPRSRFEEYYHRITPIPDVRSRRLERTEEGKIRVYLDSSFGRRVTNVQGDAFVYAHGFTDRTNEVLTPLNNSVYTNSDDINYLLGAYQRRSISIDRGTEIYYNSGPVRRIEFLEPSRRESTTYKVGITGKDNKYSIREIDATNPANTDLFDESLVKRIELPSEDITEDDEDDVFAQVRGKREVVGKMIQLPYGGGAIYKVGPASNLPISRNERIDSPVLETIPQNAAAIFRYVDRAEALAERIALEDKAANVERPELFDKIGKKKTVELPSVESSDVLQSIFTANQRFSRQEKIGLEENSADLLKLAIGDSLGRFVFPSEMDELQLDFTRAFKGKKAEGYVVTPKQALPEEYSEVINTIINDSLGGAVIKKLTDNGLASRSDVSTRGTTITIPIVKGRVYGAGVTFKRLQ